MTDASTLGSKAPHWEAAAIDNYLSGDEYALDEIVTTYQTKAFWVARHVVRHDEVAQDIVQEAFVRVYASTTCMTVSALSKIGFANCPQPGD